MLAIRELDGCVRPRLGLRARPAGTRMWFSGRATCLRYLAHVIGAPGDWRMAHTLANGQPAAVASYRASAYGLGVLTVTPAGIACITVFAGGPDLAASFGLA